jgi:hypothetical protein
VGHASKIHPVINQALGSPVSIEKNVNKPAAYTNATSNSFIVKLKGPKGEGRVTVLATRPAQSKHLSDWLIKTVFHRPHSDKGLPITLDYNFDTPDKQPKPMYTVTGKVKGAS